MSRRLLRQAAVLSLFVWCVSPLFPASSGVPLLEGTWVGVMTQPGGPYDSYVLRIEITQDGPKITGTSRIEIPGTDWYGEMPLEGTWDGDSLAYREGWMISDNIPSEIAWCLKKAVLRLIPATDSSGRDSLVGPWEAPSCLPGRIMLERTGERPTISDTSMRGRFAPEKPETK